MSIFVLFGPGPYHLKHLEHNFGKLHEGNGWGDFNDITTPYDPLSVMQYSGDSFQIGTLPTLSYVQNGKDTGVPVQSQAGVFTQTFLNFINFRRFRFFVCWPFVW